MADVVLRTGEYVEDLQFDDLRIILSHDLPSFTTDAVLLSDFARLKKSDTAADLGTGTGILPLLTYGRYGMKMTGFEVQSALCDMAQRSFVLNGLDEHLSAVCMDVREAYREYNGAFSAVVCNPPYFSGGILPESSERRITRSQDDARLFDFVQAAARILRSGGRFYCSYPSTSLAELIYELKKNKLEPKRMRFVRSTAKKPPYLVLTEARKDGGAHMDIEDDLIILGEDGSETEEIRIIYHRNS